MGIHWIPLPILPNQIQPNPKNQKNPKNPKNPENQENKKKPKFPLEIIAKPKETQYFYWESLQNQWKTNISLEIKGKPMENIYFQLKNWFSLPLAMISNEFVDFL